MAVTAATSGGRVPAGGSGKAKATPTSQGANAPGTAPNNVTPYQQPGFDRRLWQPSTNPFNSTLNLATVGGVPGQINRGYMIWDEATQPPAPYVGNSPAHVNFLFNPSTISTSYTMASGAAQAALNYPTPQGGAAGINLLVPLQQQVSWTLMYDRTYEMTDPKGAGAGSGIGSTDLANIAQFGVDVDIAAIRQYTGMYATPYQQSDGQGSISNGVLPFTAGGGGATSGSTPSSPGTPAANAKDPLQGVNQGIMQMTLGFVFFSGFGTQGSGSPGHTGISYYGYVDSWDVEYTHFNQFMIPMRAVVNLSFTLLPPPPSVNNAGAIAVANGQIAAIAAAIAAGNGGTAANSNGTGIGGR